MLKMFSLTMCLKYTYLNNLQGIKMVSGATIT